jgi:hypothetical protein
MTGAQSVRLGRCGARHRHFGAGFRMKLQTCYDLEAAAQKDRDLVF